MLVLGAGNPLAGDDGFGGAVIDRLRGREDRPGGVDLLDAGTDLLGQIETFAAYDDVILVDAVVGAGHAGHVSVLDEQTAAGWADGPASAHHLSPLTAIRLFRALHPEARTRVTTVALSADRLALGGAVPEAAVAAGVDAVTRLWAQPGDHDTRLS